MPLLLVHRILLGLALAILLTSALGWTGSSLSQWATLDSAAVRAFLQAPAPETASPLLGLLGMAFLHADLAHLGGNLLYFWIFGGLVGELVGWRWMLGIFLLTALSASGAFVLLNPDGLSIGASGAVSGFMGAYLGLAVRWHLPFPEIWPLAHPVPPTNLIILGCAYFVLDLLGIFGAGVGIAYSAHLGGFLGGLILTSFLLRPEKPHSAR
ncbi:MAG: rhomboid family intramembrane serine protease [Verrucomicrobiota bacterium]